MCLFTVKFSFGKDHVYIPRLNDQFDMYTEPFQWVSDEVKTCCIAIGRQTNKSGYSKSSQLYKDLYVCNRVTGKVELKCCRLY